MADLASIFASRLDFDPGAGDIELFARQAPAKWVVYLFTDAADQPVQLLCVKNLRASLKRRLGGQETIGPTRKVNYRELVRRVYWTRVDSAFEADLVYLDAARAIFPQTYRGLMGIEPAWFVHVDPEQRFPRYTKTIDLDKKGILIGPIQDKHAAARFVQLIEDAFDLCRYYNVLTQAPHGRACAYKEMGKCPAPCDGSISMEQYRQMVRWSAEVAVDPAPYLREHEERMQAAAMDLNFEAAARIKQYIDQVAQFGKGPFKFARRLEDFRFLSVQPGPSAGLCKLFLITPGSVQLTACLVGPPISASYLLRQVLQVAQATPGDTTPQGVQRLGIVADHLLRPRKSGGIFLPLDHLDDRSLARAYRDLQKQKAAPEDSDDEGVVKELQQI